MFAEWRAAMSGAVGAMKKLFLIGGGGHCVSVIDVIEKTEQFSIQGIFDSGKPAGEKILGYPVLGSDSEIKKYISSENYFLITVGQIQSADVRKKIFETCSQLGVQWATILSPLAHVSKHASVDEGSVVMHGALVNAQAVVGKNVIVNTKALIEHDARVGSHCHVATGAIINGATELGEGVFVGSQSVVVQNIKVPAQTFIQAGTFYRGSDKAAASGGHNNGGQL